MCRHPGRARFDIMWVINCSVLSAQLHTSDWSMTALMLRETPFHGLIPPFPIRVDQFGAFPGLTAVPALHLLSHTHSDHILGLSAKSFASTIICSPDAKEMLLRHELYSERFLRDVDLRDEARLSRTFGHLKVSPCLKDGKLDFSVGRDFLVCYSYM